MTFGSSCPEFGKIRDREIGFLLFQAIKAMGFDSNIFLLRGE